MKLFFLFTKKSALLLIVLFLLTNACTNETPKTFTVKNSADPYYYQIEDGKVELHYGIKTTVLEEADPLSFKQIHEYYGIDQYSVFYLGKKFNSTVDMASFEVLDNDYSRDKDHVFYRGELLEDTDPKSFQTLTGQYSMDDEYVYFDGQLVEGADISSFSIFEGNYQGFATDKNTAYYIGRPITGSDPISFEVINSGYSKDASHVFFLDQMIVGANPESFELVPECDWCAKDVSNLFFEGKVYEGTLEEIFLEEMSPNSPRMF